MNRDLDRSSCPNYTRRQFLAGLGASAAVAVAGGFGISVWGRHPAAMAAVPAPGSFGVGTDRTLIVVEMGGGNDGLNTVVPHAAGRYYDVRGDLAVSDPIDLDGTIGLHPSLGFVAQRFRSGQVAIVEGVGYPDPDLSHFASMSTWWTGMPGAVGQAGWLGRYLDGTVGTDDPLAGVSVGPGPAPALAGERSFVVAIQDLTGLSPSIAPWIDDLDELMGMWQGFAPAAFDGVDLLDEVRAAISGTVAAAGTVNDVLAGAAVEAPSDRRPGGALSTQLQIAAALVTSQVAPRVIYVHGWGDFDTHEGQANRHAALMTELDEGVRTFFDLVERGAAADRVALLTTSEFGRRVTGNGSGTDHGTAATQFLIGSGVAGGRHGEAPSLTALDPRGNLVHTVDYRSLYASVLDGWLGVSHADVLAGEHETLPLFQPPRRRAEGPI